MLREGSSAVVHLTLLRQLVDGTRASLDASRDPEVSRVLQLVIEEAHKLVTGGRELLEAAAES